MPPKLRVLSYNERHEKRMKNEISSSLASVLRTNPKLTPTEAMWTVTNEMLANNPYQPPKDGKCPINDLPNEILTYIFNVGVEQQVEEEMEGEDDEDAWVDESSDEGSDSGSGESDSDEEVVGKPPSKAVDVIDIDDDDDGEDFDDDEEEFKIPFQILVSHVCKRWREVAIDSHALWTTLDFHQRPRLEKAKMYISRAQGLPLDIFIDCTFPEDIDEEDHPDHPLYADNLEARRKIHAECHGCDDEHDHDFDVQFLSHKQLTQILDLVEPEVSHWRSFDFRASTYGYVQLLLSRLHALPSAPLLEVLQVSHFEDCEDYESFSGDDKTAYLPFNGVAPLLKEVVLWGVHIDWDAPLLRGLRDLELAYHAKDVRPSYKAFQEIIKGSPDLERLTLSISGPALPEGVEFDADPEEHKGAWGPTPLTIPSLRGLVLQFHEVKYASALVQHIDAPGLTDLLLNFDEEDYSSFVRTLIQPVKGRTESVLQHIKNLKISGLPCDVASAEAFLSQLVNVTNLNLKVVGPEEEVLFHKLIDPYAARKSNEDEAATGDAPITPLVAAPPSESRPAPSFTPAERSLPKLFLPKLESLTTNLVEGPELKELITARRALGAPIKSLLVSAVDAISTKEENWLRKNVQEFDYFDPSDSDEDIDDIEIRMDDDDSQDEGEDDDDEGSDDDDDEPPRDENGEPLISPLARHMRTGRRTGGDLD